MSSVDLLIVGGGPAGMSAAVAAADAGVDCCLVDEGLDLGGQIYRRPTRVASAPAPHPRGEALYRAVAERRSRIEVRSQAAVWGIFAGGGEVAVSAAGRSEVLRPRRLVLAPGAHEYVPPFPGWTLPGVMTPGAAQVLVKTMGIAPGKRAVVAGSGPFLLVVACQLLACGVEVKAVLEASPRLPWLGLPWHGHRAPGLLREGLSYLRTLYRAGVPVRYGRVATEAMGEGSVQAMTHAPVDADWRPDLGRSEREEVDTLLVGYGFVPRAALAQAAGVALTCRPEVGGFVPVRDRDLRTSVESVLAAGDGAGSAGALSAALEGSLAGLVAARDLGALDGPALAARRAPLERGLSGIAGLRRALDRICLPRPGLLTLLRDDTIVCRCEEVTWREARAAVGHGCTRYPSLKVATRLGMGPCQGRFCWPAMSAAIARQTGASLAEVGPASVRPPLRPVALGELAGMGTAK